jgi:hypothetical protein
LEIDCFFPRMKEDFSNILPQPMPFTLRARWKVQDIVTDGIAFSPNGDWLAALVLTSQQGQLTLTVQLWQIPKTQTNPKVFFVSQQVQQIGISSPQLGFSPDGRLLAVGYLEQGVGKVDLFKVALFTVPEGRRLQTITMGKWVIGRPPSPSPPMGDWQLSLTSDFGSFGLTMAKRRRPTSERKVLFFRPTVSGWWLTKGYP